MGEWFYKTKAYQNLSCFSTTVKTIYRNIRGKKFESEVKVLKKFISEGSIVFDVGAAYGRYTLPFCRLVGSYGHVYSFEPGSYSYGVLSTIVKFHRLRNVTIMKKALSNKSGTLRLILPIKKSGKAGPSLAYLSEQGNSNCITEDVEMTTIDNYCEEMNVFRVDFIKCDVEGAELLVFKGGRNTIERYKPTILCEVDKGNLEKFRETPERLYEFIVPMGYKSFIFERNTFNEVDCIVRDSNYFFIHGDNEELIEQLV